MRHGMARRCAPVSPCSPLLKLASWRTAARSRGLCALACKPQRAASVLVTCQQPSRLPAAKRRKQLRPHSRFAAPPVCPHPQARGRAWRALGAVAAAVWLSGVVCPRAGRQHAGVLHICGELRRAAGVDNRGRGPHARSFGCGHGRWAAFKDPVVAILPCALAHACGAPPRRGGGRRQRNSHCLYWLSLCLSCSDLSQSTAAPQPAARSAAPLLLQQAPPSIIRGMALWCAIGSGVRPASAWPSVLCKCYAIVSLQWFSCLLLCMDPSSIAIVWSIVWSIGRRVRACRLCGEAS